MKKILFFVVAALSLQAHAQFPFFLREHSGNGINYGAPVDIEFDGTSKFYSLHYSTQTPGSLITQYDAITGNVLNVSYLIRGNAAIKPVRIHVLWPNYYVLFNSVSGAGVAGYCLVSLNATSNVVNWAQAFAPPVGGAPRNAIDFILDGGNFAYILSNAYDAVNNQLDPAVTAVNITTPGLVWDNIYQNVARTENAGNIIYRAASNELIVSAISADLANPVIDRGPMLMRLSPGGGYLASMLYEYAPGCTHAEPNDTWVGNGTNNFYLSSTSYDAGLNGPLWLSKINPVSLGINIQTNHQTNTAYMNPKMQAVLGSAGNYVLMSGSSPTASGYVHAEFNTSGLTFAQGVIYPSTNPRSNGSPMFDAYNTTGVGLNIFSIAENAATTTSYYLMKTNDVGRNDCDDPYQFTQDNCIMNSMGINFTQVPIALTTGPVLCSTTPRSNIVSQSCYVPFIMAPNPGGPREMSSTFDIELIASPNPTRGVFTLSAGKSILSDIRISNTDGKTIPVEISEVKEGVSINLSGKKAGIYVVQVLVDGEPKNTRILLE